ncbi:MAG: hypothetical protein MI923_16465 [Phycisphaerales bacterium]|nr:hypothetical protein [Phycisphaerales bacterium]
MIDVLERFTIPNLFAVLGLLILMWLFWPVLCGILGARRGQGLQGAAFGLLLGPLGLLPILLSRPRRVCSTCPACGRRELSPVRRHVPAALIAGDVAKPPVVVDTAGQSET